MAFDFFANRRMALLAAATTLALATAPVLAQNQNPRVKLATSLGDIVVELDAAKAPKSVENFVQYVNDKHYDGTIFHRVIDGFMIQGGGYAPGFEEKETRAPIKNEAANGLSNKIGTIAMARTMEPHSASAQFFINVNNNDFLDFKSATTQGFGYCVFGEVTAGMDVVNKIKGVKTGNYGRMHQDVPTEDVVITKVTLAE